MPLTALPLPSGAVWGGASGPVRGWTDSSRARNGLLGLSKLMNFLKRAHGSVPFCPISETRLLGLCVTIVPRSSHGGEEE